MVKRRRSGRPKQGDERGRTKALSARITPELRAKLDQAAEENAHALSDEIEERLLASFRLEDERAKIFDSFGGRKNFAACRCIAMLMTELATTTGKSWSDDGWVFEQLRQGILRMLSQWHPGGPEPEIRKPEPPLGKPPLPDELGESFAAGLLAKLDFTAGSAFDEDPTIRRIKHGLGELYPPFSRYEERLPAIEAEQQSRKREQSK